MRDGTSDLTDGLIEEQPRIAEAPGHHFALVIPAHRDALIQAGTSFLTKAFRATGALAADNAVVRITNVADCPGGSTGAKLFLTLDYAQPGPPREVFVKFSRDFEDAIRDRGRDQLEGEVRLALLSLSPTFPISVARCLYADYQPACGTGLLITDRVAFGHDGIEPAYDKCMDHALPDAIGHYRALVSAVARLAGAHRAGQLPQDMARSFPFDAQAQNERYTLTYDDRQLRNRVARYGAFAAEFPQLLPSSIRSAEFLAQLSDDAALFRRENARVCDLLNGSPDLIALCHWNANVDNAWFWRNELGELHCGLLDWGRVGQMNVALALVGCLSAAEHSMLEAHLDDLLALFADEYAACGGPVIDPAELKRQFCFIVALMMLGWMIDSPPLLRSYVPDLADAIGPLDSRFLANEAARTQLHMLTNFLTLWERLNFGARLRAFLDARPS